MVRAAATTLDDGVPLATGQGRLHAVTQSWSEAKLGIQVRLKAYFDTETVNLWEGFDAQVQSFLDFCRSLPGIRADVRQQVESGRLSSPDASRYLHERILDLVKLFPLPLRAADIASLQLSESTVAGNTTIAINTIKSALLAQVETLVDDVLDGHPNGFSTTRRDLLDDLLP
jgi:hypothetical protein